MSNLTPDHAVAVIRLEETQNLLTSQIEATATARVRALQLEQQISALQAEVQSLRPAEAPSLAEPESPQEDVDH